MQKLVSVIVPVYQAEKYLDRCIQSILKQTYPVLEVLLIDDGSRDQSLKICRKYEETDARIQVFHQANQGVSSARNTGLAHMTGDYVLFADADDYIDQDMVADLLIAVDAVGADLAICGFRMVFDNGAPDQLYQTDEPFVGNLSEFMETQFLECYDRLLINTQSNKLCSAKLIRDYGVHYHSDMAINEDLCISLEMLMYSNKLVTINRSYMNYWQYQQPQSLVTRFNENGLETCFTALKVMQECLAMGGASKMIVNEMNNRMLFHICGFAGLPYYRSDYSNQQCYRSIRELAARKDLQGLLKETKTSGLKNTVAWFLLRWRMAMPYHLLCRLVYTRKRSFYRDKKRVRVPERGE